MEEVGNVGFGLLGVAFLLLNLGLVAAQRRGAALVVAIFGALLLFAQAWSVASTFSEDDGGTANRGPTPALVQMAPTETATATESSR